MQNPHTFKTTITTLQMMSQKPDPGALHIARVLVDLVGGGGAGADNCISGDGARAYWS